MSEVYGFIGLGNMGLPMAANITQAGHELLVYDIADVDLSQLPGARQADHVDLLWTEAESVFLSLPNGAICKSVLETLLGCKSAVTRQIIDLSTIGTSAAREFHELLGTAGMNYIDCPVSGGVAGARAGTITLIWAGSGDLLNAHRRVLETFSGNIFHISEQPGYGQAMKLINNFLSACNMAATAEAMAFGVEEGLDMRTMLEVINVSTGYNSATRDKFLQRVVSKTYDAGFSAEHMNKDVQLYLQGTRVAGLNVQLGRQVGQIWQAMHEAMPGGDLSEIYKFISEK